MLGAVRACVHVCMRMLANGHVREKFCSPRFPSHAFFTHDHVRALYSTGSQKNVFSYYRMCSLTIECVLLLRSTVPAVKDASSLPVTC